MPAPEQPVGPAVPGWTPRPLPARAPIDGRYCRLEPLEPGRHAWDLWEANALDTDGRHWTYLFTEPPATREAYVDWAHAMAATADPLFFAILIDEGRRLRA